MAPCKPTKAGATGEDPGSLGEGWSCYLGKSLVKESDLADLILTSVLAEGQATCWAKAVVPSPGDRRTVVFAAFFTTGLRLPCDDFLPSVLERYEVKLPQLSPLAFPKLAIFAWMCRTCGLAPTAELFAVLFTACTTTKDVNTHAGRAEEDSFRLRELYASAGAFGRLAGACVDGKMGPQLDAEVVLRRQPILHRGRQGELAPLSAPSCFHHRQAKCRDRRHTSPGSSFFTTLRGG
uniref:Retrotransposon protein n=2 Tax=Oryza sativa subsp. japonica TaxID=39947 RepID=Q10IJ2_ORYSJ|nr:putative retrotransposon protein [Oryza sativa Japonica Group]AAO73252.1 hypothetical protein [Oryza sativa Japonica Group]ABF96997.1 hypothetical protein LOC_Os03g34090 [Oryza sativa Japonica Group]